MRRNWTIFSVVLFLLHFRRLVSAYDENSPRRCEEIKVSMCRRVGYNMTSMPNQFNHNSQAEAETEVNQFSPLLGTNCSPDLLFFLCSLYTPICIPDYQQPLPPCKAVCERVRIGCEPVMKRHGFDWPHNLDCNRVTGRSEQLCMDSNPKTTTASPVVITPARRSSQSRTRERSYPSALQKHEHSNYFSPVTDQSSKSTRVKLLNTGIILCVFPVILIAKNY